MAQTNVISVNPSRIAEGARFPEAVLQTLNPETNSVNQPQFDGSLLNLIFPTQKTGIVRAIILFTLRIGLALTIILSVSEGLLFPNASSGFGIAAIIVGGMLTIGFFSRPLALIPALYALFSLAAMPPHTGVGLIESAILLLSVLEIYTGPGRLSLDGLMRYAIMSKRVKRHINSTSYRAFSSNF